MLLGSLFAYFTFELISSLLDSYPLADQVFLVLTWLANAAYFLTLAFQSLAFFLFFTSHLRFKKSKRRRYFYIFASLPALSCLGLVIGSISANLVFYIDNAGVYHSGALYSLYVAITGIYPIATIIFFCIYWNRLSSRSKLDLTIADVLLIAGYIFRFLFPATVVLPTFSVWAVIVIFIGVQTPRQFINGKTGLFSQEGMALMLDENIKEKENRPLLLIVVTQYQKSRDLYRDKEMDRGLLELAKFMKRQPIQKYMSYNHEGRFMVLLNSVTDAKFMENLILEKYIREVGGGENETLFFNVGIIESLDNLAYRDGYEYAISIERSAPFAEGGKVISFDEVIRAKQIREKYIQSCLDEAIKNRSVDVLFQPLKDLRTGVYIGAEALSRIKGKDGEVISPNEFIYLAEQNGSIKAFSEIVYEKVLDFLITHNEESFPLKTISINLSPILCLDPGMAKSLIDKAKFKGIGLSRINFEITETAFINLDVLKRQMEEIIMAGGTFSLDDFGTGYSDLARVTSLPFSAIKFDISLVRSYCAGQNTFLPYLSKAVKNIKRKIVAEGIEDPEIEKKVMDLDIDYGQGYLYSKPVSEEELLKSLNMN